MKSAFFFLFFFSWKEKNESLWGRGGWWRALFTSPEFCSLPQSATTTRREKKKKTVSGFPLSVSLHRLCWRICSKVPRRLLFFSFWNTSPRCFLSSFFPKSFRREVRRGRGQEAGRGAGWVISSLHHVVFQIRPPAPCAASGRCSAGSGRRSGGGASVERRGSAALIRPSAPPLREDGSESVVKEPK